MSSKPESQGSPYDWMKEFTPISDEAEGQTWLEWLVDSPHGAVDALMRGEADLSGYEQVGPCEALQAMMGGLSEEAPEWGVLDEALLKWLQQRRHADEAMIDSHGGIRHFIAEVGEGLRAGWQMGLPRTSAWTRADFPDLLRWAEAISVDSTYDLARSVLVAGAHLQYGDEWRSVWLRICRESAFNQFSLRRDVALRGLARQPLRDGEGFPSNDMMVGVANWASQLPQDEESRALVVNEWLALRAMFPLDAEDWSARLDAIPDVAPDHPFHDWMKQAENSPGASLGT